MEYNLKTFYKKLKIQKSHKLFKIINNKFPSIKKINSRRKTGRSINLWKSINTLLNNQWAKEVAREIRKYLETNENEKHNTKNYGMQ